jgi:hypothetical protein
MTERPGKALPEAASDPSSRNRAGRGLFGSPDPLWIGLLAAGLAAALLMIAAEFTTLRSVSVLTASCSDLADPSLRGSCVTIGHEEHSYALVLIGVVTLVMACGATLGRSRPAAAALALLGAAVLLIALAIDVPHVHRTGVLGARFESAHAEPGPALWLEIAGGALAFATGIVATVALPRRRGRKDRQRRKRREERLRARA